MGINENFEIAAGTVAGRTHVIAGKPNQDAFATFSAGYGVVGVVCDGCGSCRRSEVGAAMGAKILCEAIAREMEAGADLSDPTSLERVRGLALAALEPLVTVMGKNRVDVINEFFLFTVMGIAISKQHAVVFGIGDGVFAVGDAVVTLGPFPGNAPPYLGYGLFREGPRFVQHKVLLTDDVQSVLVGTDGAADFHGLAGTKRPGGDASRAEVVPPLRDFWQDDRYFRNEDALRRALYLVNREVIRPAWTERRLHKEPGLLEDDTTLLVVRRKKSAL